MAVEVLVFVPSLVLVQLFRRIQSRRPRQQAEALCEILCEIKGKPAVYIFMRFCMIKQKCVYVFLRSNVKSSGEKEWKLEFPWWFVFIAYGLSFLLSVVSIFFTVVRGIQFGDVKTQKWLTSLLSGFLSSILVIQPLKVSDSLNVSR